MTRACRHAGRGSRHHATAQARTPVGAAVIATRAVPKIIALPLARNRHARCGSPHVAQGDPTSHRGNAQGHAPHGAAATDLDDQAAYHALTQLAYAEPTEPAPKPGTEHCNHGLGRDGHGAARVCVSRSAVHPSL